LEPEQVAAAVTLVENGRVVEERFDAIELLADEYPLAQAIVIISALPSRPAQP